MSRERAGQTGSAVCGALLLAAILRRISLRQVEGTMVEASCHCGAVRLELARAPRALTACNCSLCRRYGTLWAYYPARAVRFVSPVRALKFYSWGDRRLRFGRCAKCGCITHWEARKPRNAYNRMGVNMRNVEDPAAVAKLPIRMLDGAATWKVLHSRAQPDLFRSPPRRKSR